MVQKAALVSPLHSKLAAIRERIDVRQSQRTHGSSAPRSKLPPTDRIGEDGVDHINIWQHGKTDLGVALAHETRLGIHHKYFGRFASMESFWCYISSVERDDRLRNRGGRPLKDLMRTLTHTHVENFRAVVMDANYQKVCEHKEIYEALLASTLPIDMYETYRRSDGIRIRPSAANWMIDGFHEIRKAIQEGREPNFDFLMKNRKLNMYEGLLSKETIAEIDANLEVATQKRLDRAAAWEKEKAEAKAAKALAKAAKAGKKDAQPVTRTAELPPEEELFDEEPESQINGNTAALAPRKSGTTYLPGVVPTLVNCDSLPIGTEISEPIGLGSFYGYGSAVGIKEPAQTQVQVNVESGALYVCDTQQANDFVNGVKAMEAPTSRQLGDYGA